MIGQIGRAVRLGRIPAILRMRARMGCVGDQKHHASHQGDVSEERIGRGRPSGSLPRPEPQPRRETLRPCQEHLVGKRGPSGCDLTHHDGTKLGLLMPKDANHVQKSQELLAGRVELVDGQSGEPARFQRFGENDLVTGALCRPRGNRAWPC